LSLQQLRNQKSRRLNVSFEFLTEDCLTSTMPGSRGRVGVVHQREPDRDRGANNRRWLATAILRRIAEGLTAEHWPGRDGEAE
jgi:hypothetical protein